MPADNPLTSPFRGIGRNSLVDAFYGFPPGRKRTIPEIVASVGQESAGAASISFTKPVKVHPGTLMVVLFTCRNSVPTTPSGWKEIGHKYNSADTAPGLAAYYRVADTTDDSVTSYTFGSSNAQNKSLVFFAVEGVDPVEPFYAWNFNYDTGGQTVLPRCGILDRDCLVVALAGASSANNGQTPIITFGTPFTKKHSEGGVGATRLSCSYATYVPSEVSGYYDDYVPLSYPSTVSATFSNPEALVVLAIQGEMVAGTN